MKFKIRLISVLALLVCSMAVAAQKKPQMKRVYMFGFAASFTDSLAFQTDIQQIDSAWLDEHKFLVDRSLYSLQLQYYVENQMKRRNPTSTVFFNTNLRRLQRTWRKVHKRYEKTEGLRITTLPRSSFAFKAEEYRPIIQEIDTTSVAPTPPTTPAQKD